MRPFRKVVGMQYIPMRSPFMWTAWWWLAVKTLPVTGWRLTAGWIVITLSWVLFLSSRFIVEKWSEPLWNISFSDLSEMLTRNAQTSPIQMDKSNVTMSPSDVISKTNKGLM